MTSSGPIHHSRFPAQQGQRSAHSGYSFLPGPLHSAAWDRLCGQAARAKGPERPRP